MFQCGHCLPNAMSSWHNWVELSIILLVCMNQNTVCTYILSSISVAIRSRCAHISGCWSIKLLLDPKHFKQSLHGRINTCTRSSSSMWWVGARARAIHSLYASSSICHSTIPEDVNLTGICKIHDVRTYISHPVPTLWTMPIML